MTIDVDPTPPDAADDEEVFDDFDDPDDELDYDPDLDDPMDGDHESALASAGFGTDEDYGGGDDRLTDDGGW